MPGVLCVLTGADCLAEGLNPLPHSPVPSTNFDMKLTAPDGGMPFIGPHHLLPADRARHVGHAVAMVVAETRAQAMDAAEAVRVEYEELPWVTETSAAAEPGAPSVWDEAPGNVFIDTFFGDKAAADAAFAKADRTVRATLRHRPRHRRDDGAARRARPLRRANRPLHALRRLGRRGEAEAGDRRLPRHPPGRPAGAVVRCRRQFRRAQPALCRVRAGAVGLEKGRPRGEIHRHALRGVPHRLSGPRPDHHGRARVPQGRKDPCDARRQPEQRRLACACRCRRCRRAQD